jgi:transposase-like protein
MEKQVSRGYPEPLRQKIVKEVLQGKINKDQARKQYGIKGKTIVLKWIRIYEKYGVCSLTLARNPQPLVPNKEKKQRPHEQQELEARIKFLEQKLEDESLLREMYSRMIDIAEKEYKIPIRKKPNTK